MAIFANNPAVLQGYLALDDVYEDGSFTSRERQIILLAAWRTIAITARRHIARSRKALCTRLLKSLQQSVTIRPFQMRSSTPS